MEGHVTKEEADAELKRTADRPIKKKAHKQFDMSKYPQKHIVLRLAYHGHDFDGLAKQDHTTNTIEHHVVEAMKRVRLIPESGPEKFSRCGRTDKGVSALGNAFSMIVRGNVDESKPLDYCKMINNCLPAAIRITGWSFVPDDFDARFSCEYRMYRYFFTEQGRDLSRMLDAAARLKGTHDFRNFCKMDVVNVSNFVREIQHVEIHSVGNGLHYLEIRGNAFLYHQIRCIMAILFMIGAGQEEPSVVDTLLDVETTAAKPCYALADDAPLVLWDCAFNSKVVQWQVSAEAMAGIVEELTGLQQQFAIRSAIAASMKQQLSVASPEAFAAAASYVKPGTQAHVSLLERPVELTYEQRIAGLSASKRKRWEQNRSKGAPATADGDE